MLAAATGVISSQYFLGDGSRMPGQLAKEPQISLRDCRPAFSHRGIGARVALAHRRHGIGVAYLLEAIRATCEGLTSASTTLFFVYDCPVPITRRVRVLIVSRWKRKNDVLNRHGPEVGIREILDKAALC